MQFVSAVKNDTKFIEKELSAGLHLPYTRHINNYTIETRNGLLMQFIKVKGFLFETSDTSEINYRKTLRDSMLRAIGTSRFAIYQHVIRRRVEPDLDGEFPDNFSAQINDMWRVRLGDKKLYVNDIILTLVRRPLQGNVGILDGVFNLVSGSKKNIQTNIRRELSELNSARDALISQLSTYEPELLSVYSTENGECSEPLEFLSALLNGEVRPVLLPYQAIGDYLPSRRISFGTNTVELSATGYTPREFVAIVSVKDYPGYSASGMFDELMRLPFELVITQSFGFVERSAVLSKMDLSLRRMTSANDDAISLKHELTQAKDDVSAGRAGFGEHHISIAIRATSVEEIDFGVAEIMAVLADLGAIAVREDIALESAFWAQFPGNFKYITRRALISTSNFAGLASLHNFASGSPANNHWGNAITLLETTASGPYYFNFHHGDLGNFTIIGPSGSGKTVVLNFLLAQARKLDPKIVFFDKDRGAELFLRAMGGRYDRLHPDSSSGINPLQLENTPANRQFLIDWVSQLTSAGDNPTELETIKDAVEANFAAPNSHKRLRHFAELFRGRERPNANDLWSRLRPWFGDGEKAWLFDNIVDKVTLQCKVQGFDMTAILDDPVARTPAMMALFHKIESMLDGAPTIIVIDEGWKALDDEVFVRKLKDWEKTIRKRNGIIGFTTQSAQDALNSKISSAIIEQAATQIFMANPKGLEEEYVEGFGLSQHEFELVKNLPSKSHCFLIKNGRECVVARLNLSGEQKILSVLSGGEHSVRVLDNLLNDNGVLPDNWLDMFWEQV